MQWFEDQKKKLDEWVKAQPPAVEIGLITGGGAVQGEFRLFVRCMRDE